MKRKQERFKGEKINRKLNEVFSTLVRELGGSKRYIKDSSPHNYVHYVSLEEREEMRSGDKWIMCSYRS
jgi:hypothetical protein